MQEVKLWILVSLVVIMGSVLGFIGKVVTKIIIQRLDDIVKELRELNKASSMHAQDIKNLQEADTVINHRLNNHADRIRVIEMKGAKTNHIDT